MKSIPILLTLAAAAHAQPIPPPATSLEDPAVLRSSELLPQELLKGPNHRIRDLVPTDGFMAHFTIDTDFGVMSAVGVREAKLRILEANALRKLTDTSKSDLFAEGLKRSIEKPIDAVKNIADDPVESVKKVPHTVGHFFKKVGSSVERTVNKVSDRHNSGNDPSVQEVGRGIGNTAKHIAGFEKAKLDTARQLGVDPYSDNDLLKEEINKVTWAFFAGGLPLRIGAAAVSAGVTLTATNMVGIPEDIYDLTASEIHLRDKETLTALGLREADIDAFQITPVLSVSRQHRIVTCLRDLPHAAGRGNIILLATRCTEPAQVEILIQSLAILAERQKSGAADYLDLKVLGRLPGATTASGTLEVPAPVDFVSWTDEVSAAARRDDLAPLPKTLVHTGTLSPAATAGFAAAHWKLEAVPYPTAP